MKRYWHLGYLLIIFTLVALVYNLYLMQLEDTVAAPQKEDLHSIVTEEIRNVQTGIIIHTQNYSNLTWLGKPIWQPPLDLWILQETIYEIQPELIIECGTFKGGSSYFFAQILDDLGKGRVITIDIERMHDLSHPRVTYLIGDSASPEIVGQVRAEAAQTEGPIMVILDSDHSMAHVLRELEAYSDLVTPGSYLHVQDGILDVLPVFAEDRPGPLRAIEEFLKAHDEFELDRARTEKFLLTHHPKGWLRRKSDPGSTVVPSS